MISVRTPEQQARAPARGVVTGLTNQAIGSKIELSESAIKATLQKLF